MEAKDLHTLLAEKYNDSKDKHVYFLLSIAGAGVAFAVQKTEGLGLSLQTLGAVIAILCWVCSFVSGITLVKQTHTILRKEYALSGIRADAEDHEVADTNEFKDSIEPMYLDIKREQKTAQLFQSLQINFLAAGMVALAVWYVVGLVRLTSLHI